MEEQDWPNSWMPSYEFLYELGQQLSPLRVERRSNAPGQQFVVTDANEYKVCLNYRGSSLQIQILVLGFPTHMLGRERGSITKDGTLCTFTTDVFVWQHSLVSNTFDGPLDKNWDRIVSLVHCGLRWARQTQGQEPICNKCSVQISCLAAMGV